LSLYGDPSRASGALVAGETGGAYAPRRQTALRRKPEGFFMVYPSWQAIAYPNTPPALTCKAVIASPLLGRSNPVARHPLRWIASLTLAMTTPPDTPPALTCQAVIASPLRGRSNPVARHSRRWIASPTARNDSPGLISYLVRNDDFPERLAIHISKAAFPLLTLFWRCVKVFVVI
jgi:hypothetical protein